MKHKCFEFLILIVILAILNGCTTSDPNRPEKPAFKGMELYSWQAEDGQWTFSILIGTNRNKTLVEIQETTLDLDQVKQQFCEMAKGEQVFWMSGVQDSTSKFVPFPPVPADIIAELQAQAESCEIELNK
jgi:hypothetical protein